MPAKWLTAAKDIFFPSLCFSCERKTKQEYLCAACQEQIHFLFPPLCRRCSAPIKNNPYGRCKNCLNKPPAYDRVISVTAYKNPMANLIHLFKYQNCSYLEKLFSRLMISHLEKIGFTATAYDFIVPVPLHPLKQKIRGYNQAALLAQALANHFKKPLKDDIIYRHEFNPSQTTVKKEKREENVEVSFNVPADLKNKKIILVDDIFTTGATISACSRVLRRQRAERITAITLAKT